MESTVCWRETEMGRELPIAPRSTGCHRKQKTLTAKGIALVSLFRTSYRSETQDTRLRLRGKRELNQTLRISMEGVEESCGGRPNRSGRKNDGVAISTEEPTPSIATCKDSGGEAKCDRSYRSASSCCAIFWQHGCLAAILISHWPALC
jgi:hypothetical protein